MLYSCPFNLNRPANRVLWEITGKCNMKCKHCLYFSQNDFAKSDLSLEQILDIINEMKNDGSIDEVWLSGGEPLIRSDIFDIISAITKAGMIPSISTNGYLVTAETAVRLKAEGVNYVHLSIDGVDSIVHDEFRQKPGAFDHVILAADFLNKANIIVGATCIITWSNIADMESIVLLALEHNIKVLSFYMVEPLGRGKQINDTLDISLMKKMSKNYYYLTQQYGSKIHLELIRSSNKNTDTLAECKCYNFYTITNDGKLGGCPWLMKSNHSPVEIPLANQSFKDVRMIAEKELKRFVSDRNRCMSNCNLCKKNTKCGKGCPAVGNLKMEDPLCGYLRDEFTFNME